MCVCVCDYDTYTSIPYLSFLGIEEYDSHPNFKSPYMIYMKIGDIVVIKDAEYELTGFLGEGGFSKVFAALIIKKAGKLVDITKNPQIVAIKVIGKDRLKNPNTRKFIVDEIKLLQQFFTEPEKCKQFLCYIDFDEDRNNVYIVTENLYPTFAALEPATMHQIKQTKPGLFIHILRQMARAVQALHDLGLAHLDIKPSNWMINRETGDVKLIDYTMSCRLQDCPYTRHGMMGTPGYMDPVFLNASTRSLRDYVKADVYALGATFFIYVTNKSLIKPDNDAKRLSNNVHNVQNEFTDRIDAIIYGDLIMGMTATMPYDRLDISTVIMRLHAIADKIHPH